MINKLNRTAASFLFSIGCIYSYTLWDSFHPVSRGVAFSDTAARSENIFKNCASVDLQNSLPLTLQLGGSYALFGSSVQFSILRKLDRARLFAGIAGGRTGLGAAEISGSSSESIVGSETGLVLGATLKKIQFALFPRIGVTSLGKGAGIDSFHHNYFNLDAGMILMPGQTISFGLSFRNIAMPAISTSRLERMPIIADIGIAIIPMGWEQFQITFAGDLALYADGQYPESFHFSSGIRAEIFPDRLSLSAGVRSLGVSDVIDLGTGMRIILPRGNGALFIDYGLGVYFGQGTTFVTHATSIGFSF